MIAFNSLSYVAFLAAVVAVYWLLPTKKQNLFLLLASYVFYASWDWRFLSLILFSTAFNFYLGRAIDGRRSDRPRKNLLILSVAGNLALLGFFKYYNFFLESLNDLLALFGTSAAGLRLEIILPIGISFYTFQAMTYSIDIYRRQSRPTESFSTFALFIVFFPQLVAGPIERSQRLIPQIENSRTINRRMFVAGLDLIFWGMLKKVFVADNVASYVNMIFAVADPSTLLVAAGVLGFGIQIFCDFSAYTDIARGSAYLMGFRLRKNFKRPYLAKNAAQFWRRWHVTLSDWIRDYVYIPLGGSRGSRRRVVVNLMITWILCGLWHGAAWNFVFWGAYHGLWLVFHRALAERKAAVSWPRWMSILQTFFFVHVGWLLFRVHRASDIASYFSLDSLRLSVSEAGLTSLVLTIYAFFLLPLVAYAAWRRLRARWRLTPREIHFVRGLSYAITLLLIAIFAGANPRDFIYFQF